MGVGLGRKEAKCVVSVRRLGVLFHMTNLNTLHCSTGHALLFLARPMKQKTSLMKCVPEHTARVTHNNSHLQCSEACSLREVLN